MTKDTVGFMLAIFAAAALFVWADDIGSERRHERTAAVHQAGQDAAALGVSADICPYSAERNPEYRSLWMSGWAEGVKLRSGKP